MDKKEPDYSVSLTDIMTEKANLETMGEKSGASAGYVAIHREKPDEVYLIGHDLHSATDNVNNLYKSTRHYVATRKRSYTCCKLDKRGTH